MSDAKVDVELGQKIFLLMCIGAGSNTAARNLGLLTAAMHGRRVVTEMFTMHLVVGEHVIRKLALAEYTEAILNSYWGAHELRQRVEKWYVDLARDFEMRAGRYRAEVALALDPQDAATRMAAFTLAQAGVDIHTHARALACAHHDVEKAMASILVMLELGGRVISAAE